MLRMSVPVGQRLEKARRFDVVPGGTESNVCAALAGLGRQAGWISRLPDGPIGRFIIRGLVEAGIDTSAVAIICRKYFSYYLPWRYFFCQFILSNATEALIINHPIS